MLNKSCSVSFINLSIVRLSVIFEYELTILSLQLSVCLSPDHVYRFSFDHLPDCNITAIALTSWHLGFASIMTQLLARTTTLLDGRKKVKMTGRVYLRAIVPIGFFFSLSLICGNKTYMYLSVSFIQMLKVCIPQKPASSFLV